MNKLIEFFGEKYSVNESIGYVAVDPNGDVFGYEKEPYFSDEFEQFLPIDDEIIAFLTTLKGDKKTQSLKQCYPVKEINHENS